MAVLHNDILCISRLDGVRDSRAIETAEVWLKA
jgi:hypothetical protein